MEFISAAVLIIGLFIGGYWYINREPKLSAYDQCVIDCMTEGSELPYCKNVCVNEKEKK
jgi:hypothetical protein